jgi:hypothetical protein
MAGTGTRFQLDLLASAFCHGRKRRARSARRDSTNASRRRDKWSASHASIASSPASPTFK